MVQGLLESELTSWLNSIWANVPFDILLTLLPLKRIAELWRQDDIEVVFTGLDNFLKDSIRDNDRLDPKVYEVERYMFEYRIFINRYDWKTKLEAGKEKYANFYSVLAALDQKRSDFSKAVEQAIESSDFSQLSFPSRLEDISMDFLLKLTKNEDESLKVWLEKNRGQLLQAFIAFDVPWDQYNSKQEQVARWVAEVTDCLDSELYENPNKLHYDLIKQIDGAIRSNKEDDWNDVRRLIRHYPTISAALPTYLSGTPIKDIPFDQLKEMVSEGLWTGIYGASVLQGEFKTSFNSYNPYGVGISKDRDISSAISAGKKKRSKRVLLHLVTVSLVIQQAHEAAGGAAGLKCFCKVLGLLFRWLLGRGAGGRGA